MDSDQRFNVKKSDRVVKCNVIESAYTRVKRFQFMVPVISFELCLVYQVTFRRPATILRLESNFCLLWVCIYCDSATRIKFLFSLVLWLFAYMQSGVAVHWKSWCKRFNFSYWELKLMHYQRHDIWRPIQRMPRSPESTDA